MGRGKNTFSLAAGFNITGQQPIDSRLVVDNVADLYLVDTWSGVGLYNGLVVAIKSTGSLFVLKDRDNYTETSSWVAVGGDVSADLSALTARVGVVESAVAPVANSGLEISAGALKVKIDSATDNALKVTDAGLKVVAPVYDLKSVESPDAQYASQYVFSKDGVNVTTINIPKDQFLKSASYDADADKLVFVFNTYVDGEYVEKTVDVDVKDLVDVYTGSDYITVGSDNTISVNYSAIKAQLSSDLKSEFAIESLSSGVAANLSAIEALQATINNQETGLSVVVGDHTAKITGLESTVSGIDTKVSNHTTEIKGLKDTLATYAVKGVDTTAAHGISLSLIDPNAEDDDTTATHVKVNVDLDTLAAAVIAKHDVPVPTANEVVTVGKVGQYEAGQSVESLLVQIEDRIRTSEAGGLTAIIAGHGIKAVVPEDSVNPTVSVVTSDLVADNSALSVVDNKIDILWSEL